MAMLRPLFSLPPRSTFEFDKKWLDRLQDEQSAHIQLSDTFVSELRKKILWYLDTVQIVRECADKKAVLDELSKIKHRSDRCCEFMGQKERQDKWRIKLLAALQYLTSPRSEQEKANRISLDYISVKLCVRNGVITNQLGGIERAAEIARTNPLVALNLIHAVLRNVDSCAGSSRLILSASNELAAVCSGMIQELSRTTEEQKRHLSCLEDQMVYGKRFNFLPDPYRKHRCSPEGDTLAEWVDMLIQLYQWAGGRTYVHKDGKHDPDRLPTPFMQFLDSLKQVLPDHGRHFGDAMHNRARVLQREI